MKPFLHDTAIKLLHQYPHLEEVTLIFPNRRAILYFRKYLAESLTQPTFSPRLLTIEDFIAAHSKRTVPDKLELVHRLFTIYQQHITTQQEQEPFDQFFFWGDMLLRDFDEVDKYRVNAELIFKDLSHQKELDASFDFLTEEQLDFLKAFWSTFETSISEHKRKFLQVWTSLFLIYTEFNENLRRDGLAYEGALHAEVAESLKATAETLFSAKPLIFCGFNALTKAEEEIITYYVANHQANIVWDTDAYYVNNHAQEAGRFFREYQQHPVLGKTFAEDIPSNLLKNSSDSQPRSIKLYGASQPVGQAKLMAQILQEEFQKGINPEETLIVLPDEKLLLPVLHGLSGHVEKLNITMGFPLQITPLFNLIELVIEMQMNKKEGHFNHRQVVALLGHPYVMAADTASSNAKRKEIVKYNWVYIPSSFLATECSLHRILFQEDLKALSILDYLQQIVLEIGSLDAITDFDKEYAFYFHTFFNRIKEVTDVLPDAENPRHSFKSFLRLFRQLVRAQKIPFTGEPLRGLQIMGVLETRNLDFKNVFILSLNEGAFPAFGGKGSYIPFNIRKAYGLPTVEHQDAIYAYLFYRVLQRAENINLFYNSETDVLGQGEMSRYLQQLLYESGLSIERKVLHNPVQPNPVTPITVLKDQRVYDQLARHCSGHPALKPLSPSALNDYLDCRLKFYFRHLARIKEADEVEEDLDARVLGNFVHQVMERFYKMLMRRNGNNIVEPKDLDHPEKFVHSIIDDVFRDAYRLEADKPVVYEGQRLVVREIVLRFTDRILAMDKAHAPFSIEAIEHRGMSHTFRLQAEGNPQVVVGGIIDRADRKGDSVRVIDYKTGKDRIEIKGSVRELFKRDSERNKAAFQTLLYAYLYMINSKTEGLKISPGLMNRVNLFDDNFTFGLKVDGALVTNVDPLLPEFLDELKNALEELFNKDVPFDQTTNTSTCRLCSFQAICYR